MNKLLFTSFLILSFSLVLAYNSKGSGVDCYQAQLDCSGTSANGACVTDSSHTCVPIFGTFWGGGECQIDLDPNHSCTGSSGNTFQISYACHDDKCPSGIPASKNGVSCRVDDGSGQGTPIRNGVWDASEGKCIGGNGGSYSCNGNFETAVWGDSSGINTQNGLGTQDNNCETACNTNLNQYVDEKSRNSGIGRCDQTGTNYFQDVVNGDNSCGLHDDTTVCDLHDSGCNAADLNKQCDNKHPGIDYDSTGYCLNAQTPNPYTDSGGTTCNYITCNSKDRGYADTSDNPGYNKCQYYNYYQSNSDAGQMRHYFPQQNACGCQVSYDSWIKEVSVNGTSSGNVNVKRTENITVNITIKNLGSTQQMDWFVGVEFWNVSDSNNPGTTRDNSGRVDAYLNRTDSGGFNYVFNSITLQFDRKPFDLAGCQIVQNSIFGPGDEIKLSCWAPAGYWPPSILKNSTMLWIHERALTQDANTTDGDGGVSTWWNDALSRSYPNDTQNLNSFGIPNDVQQPDPIKIFISGSNYGPGLTVISENNTDVLTSWLLLPQYPTKDQTVSMILKATRASTGTPLTPQDGFIPLFIKGVGTTPIQFQYLPNYYTGVGPFYEVNFTSSFDAIPITVVASSSNPQFQSWKMNGVVNLGNNSVIKTSVDFEPSSNHLTVTTLPTNLTDLISGSVNARIRNPIDFSEDRYFPLARGIPNATSYQSVDTNCILPANYCTFYGQKFYLEVLASGEWTFGRTYLTRSLAAPNIRLNVSPDVIWYIKSNFTANFTNFTLNNTGNQDINNIKIGPSSDIDLNVTIDSPPTSLAFGTSKNVNVKFDILDWAINGNIWVNYTNETGGTNTIPIVVHIIINDTKWLNVPAVTINALKDASFDKQFPIQNIRNPTKDILFSPDSPIKILDYMDSSKEISTVTGTPVGTTIPSMGTGYYRLSGKFSTVGVYNYWIEVFTTEGTKFAPLTINVSLGDPQLYAGIQTTYSNTNALILICPPTSTSKNTQQDCTDRDAIRILLGQANSSYNQGDLNSSSSYYNQAQTKYNNLYTTTQCEQKGCGIPLIYFVVIGVIAVVVVILFFAMKSEGPTESEDEGGEREDETYEELPEV